MLKVIDIKEDTPRFQRALLSGSFLTLAESFQPQINPYYCGVASATIILNALRRRQTGEERLRHVDKLIACSPLSYHHLGFPVYSQLSLLNDFTDLIKDRTEIAPEEGDETENPGLSLLELAKILRLYGLAVDVYMPADGYDVSDFRNHMFETAKVDGDRYLIANFNGLTIGKPIGGHFSPLGAYDEATDSVLVLDVAAHKTGWYWVDTNSLWLAMGKDGGSFERGYLVIRLK